jgi:hypothetical protein
MEISGGGVHVKVTSPFGITDKQVNVGEDVLQLEKTEVDTDKKKQMNKAINSLLLVEQNF